jgi:hypothetical protein
MCPRFGVLVKMFSLTEKLCKIEERHKEQNSLFQWGYYRKYGHKPGTAQSSSLSKCVEFRDIFCVVKWYTLNDQAYDKFSGNKDWFEMYRFVKFPHSNIVSTLKESVLPISM